MRYFVKRVDDHEGRDVHVLDPITCRGFVMHYTNSLDFVRLQDIPIEDTGRLLFEDYVSMEIPKEEFDAFYDKLKTTIPHVLYRIELNSEDTPTLRSIIEKNDTNILPDVLPP